MATDEQSVESACIPATTYTCMCRATPGCGCRLTNPPTHFHDGGRYLGGDCRTRPEASA